MHKCLDRMNLQIHRVISDLTGATGLAIIQAILGGERDPKILASHHDHRIKASAQTIEKSLFGDWRGERLLLLRLAMSTWNHLRANILEPGRDIETRIKALDTQTDRHARPGPLKLKG